MPILSLGPISQVEILPSPILFRVRTGQLFLRALEGGELGATAEYATFTIDETTGGFSCQSEYGDYAYSWPPHARSTDIFTFLASLGFEYFMEKAAKSPWRLFDLKQTIECHRDEIRKERRGRRQYAELSKELANDLWGALDYIERQHPMTEDEFYRLWHEQSCLGEWLVDYAPSVCKMESPIARTFWEDVWKTLIASPQFRAHMKQPVKLAS